MNNKSRERETVSDERTNGPRYYNMLAAGKYKLAVGDRRKELDAPSALFLFTFASATISLYVFCAGT